VQTATQKAYKGTGMEGWVARWYARTRRNEMEDFRLQARRFAERLRSGCDVLEVAPGPGYFAIELSKLGDFQITGLDISRTFMDIAKENAREAGARVEFRHGSASAMPFADGSFDFIYCAAAFKNFSEPVKALDEMHRVLRPKGVTVIVDLRKDVSLEEINSYVNKSGRGWFDAWMTKLAFRCMLVKRAYTQEQFEKMVEESGFGGCSIEANPMGFEVQLTRTT
jgi:ubiquinone/menaquinone biosynthesis C-methylase UbiE